MSCCITRTVSVSSDPFVPAIGALAVGEMSAAGVFDETLDWSIFNDGEMCCEHPSVPLVSEVNVR